VSIHAVDLSAFIWVFLRLIGARIFRSRSAPVAGSSMWSPPISSLTRQMPIVFFRAIPCNRSGKSGRVRLEDAGQQKTPRQRGLWIAAAFTSANPGSARSVFALSSRRSSCSDANPRYAPIAPGEKRSAGRSGFALT